MLTCPLLELQETHWGGSHAWIDSREGRFDLGDFPRDALGGTLIPLLNGVSIPEHDLGTYEGKQIFTSLSSFSYITLYFFRDGDQLGLVIQDKEIKPVGFVIFNEAAREQWLSELRAQPST